MNTIDQFKIRHYETFSLTCPDSDLWSIIDFVECSGLFNHFVLKVEPQSESLFTLRLIHQIVIKIVIQMYVG